MGKLRPGFLDLALETLGQETSDNPNVPTKNFKDFNHTVGPPMLPATGEPSDVFDYQEEYEQAWNKHHKLILNKSRKIGATETALRIIAFNCFNGKYDGHRVMIVAGNNTSVANRFIERFISIFGQGFTDLDGRWWSIDDIIVERKASKVKLWNGIIIQAYPANEATRGEENVICVFMSECAFINLLDDSKVYNALHPNVANIGHADFIMESTPNGKRGFFWELFTDQGNEYHKLEQPYTRSMGKLLDEKTVLAEKANPKIDFQQEYNCAFTTSLSAAFSEDEVIYTQKDINTYDDI